jgi:hypothetical protein
LDPRHAELLQQIRSRLTIIAIASVTVAVLIGWPYALRLLLWLQSLLLSPTWWLWIIAIAFALFTVVLILAITSVTKPPRAPATE